MDTAGTVINSSVRAGYDADLAAPVLATVQSWQPAHVSQLVRAPQQAPDAPLQCVYGGPWHQPWASIE